MKNSLKNFLDKLPGVSGKYKVFMASYYVFFAFLALFDFIRKITMDNVLFSICMFFLVLPSIIVGIRKINTLDRRGKLNYLLYPMIFILLLGVNITLDLNNENNIKRDGLKELGIDENLYKDTIEKYEQIKEELNNNKADENDYKLTEDNYKKLESSYEALKNEVDKKQEVYDNLVQKKAEKEEQERIAKAEAEKKAKEEAEKAEKVRIEKEAKAKKESSKNSQSSNKNSGTFKPNGGTASHDNRTGYDSPDSDPNEPVVTSDYGYVASGNNYIHKTPNCKFIRGKSTSKVSVSASGKHTCNCWYY